MDKTNPRGWGWLCRIVSTAQAEDLSLETQDPHRKEDLAARISNPSTGGRKRHKNPWGLLAGQTTQIHKLQA